MPVAAQATRVRVRQSSDERQCAIASRPAAPGFHTLARMALPAQLPQCPTATRRALVTATAVGCRDAYVGGGAAPPPGAREDAGRGVLAPPPAGTAHPDAAWHASRAVTV